MIRFLRLFSAFRALEADRDSQVIVLREEVNRLTTDNLRLQDRLDAVMEDRTKLWELTRECLEGERTAYQSHVNLQWQKQGFGAPYPDAPHLPPHAEPKTQQEPVTRRLLPSEAVAQQKRKFFESQIPAIQPKPSEGQPAA